MGRGSIVYICSQRESDQVRSLVTPHIPQVNKSWSGEALQGCQAVTLVTKSVGHDLGFIHHLDLISTNICIVILTEKFSTEKQNINFLFRNFISFYINEQSNSLFLLLLNIPY